GPIDLVEVRATVEDVSAGFGPPLTGRAHGVDAGRQQRGTVDHRRVDHLATAGSARLEYAAHQAEREKHAATAEVADQVQREQRPLAPTTDRVEHSGHGDVVDVVSRLLRQRT